MCLCTTVALTGGAVRVTLRQPVHAAGDVERHCGSKLRGPLPGPESPRDAPLSALRDALTIFERVGLVRDVRSGEVRSKSANWGFGGQMRRRPGTDAPESVEIGPRSAPIEPVRPHWEQVEGPRRGTLEAGERRFLSLGTNAGVILNPPGRRPQSTAG